MTRLMLTTAALSVAALSLVSGMAFAQNGSPGAHMIDQWDGNADGQITLEEARTKRGEVFYMFDIENDGVLTAEDWTGVADHMAAELGGKGQGQGQGHARGPGAKMHAAMTAAYNDADGDGQVTLAEFTAATDNLFAALDANGDKVVTMDDFTM